MRLHSAVLWSVYLAVFGCNLRADYKLIPERATLSPGGTATFQVTGSPARTDFTVTAPGLVCPAPAGPASPRTCTAPASPAAGLAVTGTVTVTATFSGAPPLAPITADVELVGEFDVGKRGPWEGRVVAGYHQAGAASSDFAQNAIIDIYTVRPLSKHDRPWLARWNSWGNVRIASAPRQLNTPFVSLLQGLLIPQPDATSPLKTNVNELALSGEFQTGIEYNFTRNPLWNGKMLGAIAYFGANGAFQAPNQTVRIYKTPDPQSPQYPLFKQEFPSAIGSPYVGFVNPDRDRFYRQWGVGFRYSKFNPEAHYESPLTFTASVGQDEQITGGRFRSMVAKFDGFYPLPVGTMDGRWKFLYLFGTVTLRLSRGESFTPLLLESAPDATKPSDKSVAIIASPSNRDIYRIGVGVDLVNLLRSIR